MMVRNVFVIFVVILFCSCKSAPIKKQYVIPSKDYKNYITLKEEPEHRTIPQKIADVFKKKEPEVSTKPKQPEQVKRSPRSESNKKAKMPLRRIRQTNTNDVTSSNQLMPMAPRPEEQTKKPDHNYFLYFIYLQAFIIALLSGYVYFKLRAPKIKKDKNKSERKLNL